MPRGAPAACCWHRHSESSALHLQNCRVQLSEQHPHSCPLKLCSGWVQATGTALCCSLEQELFSWEQELCCLCLLPGAGAVLLLAASGRGPRHSQQSTRAGRMEPSQHRRAVSPCNGTELPAVLHQVWCERGMLDTILALGLILRLILTKPAVGCTLLCPGVCRHGAQRAALKMAAGEWYHSTAGTGMGRAGPVRGCSPDTMFWEQGLHLRVLTCCCRQ